MMAKVTGVFFNFVANVSKTSLALQNSLRQHKWNITVCWLLIWKERPIRAVICNSKHAAVEEESLIDYA
jgi:hypothetical protein